LLNIAIAPFEVSQLTTDPFVPDLGPPNFGFLTSDVPGAPAVGFLSAGDVLTWLDSVVDDADVYVVITDHVTGLPGAPVIWDPATMILSTAASVTALNFTALQDIDWRFVGRETVGNGGSVTASAAALAGGVASLQYNPALFTGAFLESSAPWIDEYDHLFAWNIPSAMQATIDGWWWIDSFAPGNDDEWGNNELFGPAGY